jgi:hypothetical protein
MCTSAQKKSFPEYPTEPARGSWLHRLPVLCHHSTGRLAEPLYVENTAAPQQIRELLQVEHSLVVVAALRGIAEPGHTSSGAETSDGPVAAMIYPDRKNMQVRHSQMRVGFLRHGCLIRRQRQRHQGDGFESVSSIQHACSFPCLGLVSGRANAT